MDRFKTIKTYVTFPKNIQVIVVSELLLAGAFGIYGFLQILYLNQINIPANKIGFIFSIGSLFSMVGFFVGPFIHMFGRKNILLIGCLLSALGIGLYILFTSYIMLLLAQILINVGLCFIQVTELQLLYSYTTPDKECCAYSYKSCVNFIASSLGGLLAGNITSIPFLRGVGYKQLFIVSVIMVVGAFGVRLFFLPKDERIKPEKGSAKKSISIAINLFKTHKTIRIFAIFLFILSVGGSAIWPYNNLILKNNFFLSNTYISVIGFVITVINMVGIMVMPAIIDRVGIRIFELVALSSLIITTFCLSLSLGTTLFVIVLVLRCISACLVGSSLDSSMMSHIELENRDIFAGVKLLVNGVSCAIGNYVGGFIIEKFHYRGIYLYGVVILVGVTVLFYLKVTQYLKVEEVATEKAKCNCHLSHKYVKINGNYGRK